MCNKIPGQVYARPGIFLYVHKHGSFCGIVLPEAGEEAKNDSICQH